MSMRHGLRSLLLRSSVRPSILPLRGATGGPVPAERMPTKPIPEEDDLMWYDGTDNPEPLFDELGIIFIFKLF